MGLGVGIIIGVVLGAAIAYWVLRQKLARQSHELQLSRRVVENAEQSREARIQEAVSSVRDDYQRQLAQRTHELNQQHAAQLQQLQSQSEASSAPVEGPAPVESASGLPPTVAIAPEAVPPVSLASPVAASGSVTREPLTPERAIARVRQLSDSRQVTNIPRLADLVNHPNPLVREQVAIGLGHLARVNSGSAASHQAIAPLGKLSQDPHPNVRQVAVESLGYIPSAKVIPFLRRSLRDSDMRVVKAANAAISKYKFYAIPSASQKGAKKKSFKSVKP